MLLDRSSYSTLPLQPPPTYTAPNHRAKPPRLDYLVLHARPDRTGMISCLERQIALRIACRGNGISGSFRIRVRSDMPEKSMP